MKTHAINRIAPNRPANLQTKLMQLDGGAGGGSVSGAPYPSTMRGGRDVSFLRNWPETNVWIYSVMTMRTHQVANADFNIVQSDSDEGFDKDVARSIYDLLRKPNPTGIEKSWARLIKPVVLDLETLDSAAIQMQLKGNGEPESFNVLDGARLIPDPKWRDVSDGYRYLYRDAIGLGGKPLYDDEVVWMQSNPSSYDPMGYGTSPLQVLYKILMAELHSFQSMYVLQRNRAPGGLLIVPNSSPETIETISDLLVNELSGMSGVAVMDVPDQTRFQPISSINLQEQGAFAFYDMLIKAIATAFRTTTLALNWLQQTARATAREQAELMDDGLIDLLESVQDDFNSQVIPAFKGADNMEMAFNKLASRDEAQQAKTLRDRMGNATNWMTIREARLADGLTVIVPANEWERRWLEEPFVPAGTGLELPYSVAAEQYAPMEQGTQPAPMGQEAGARGPAPMNLSTPPDPESDFLPVNVRNLAKKLADLPPGQQLIPDHMKAGKRVYTRGSRHEAFNQLPKDGEDEAQSHEDQLMKELDDIFAEKMAVATGSEPHSHNGTEQQA